MANPLAGNVKVPGVGEVPKAAAAAGLAVVGYLIYRYRTTHAAAAAGTGTSSGTGTSAGQAGPGDAYPWDGSYNNPSDPYSMDTSSGQTYGDEGYGGGGGAGGGGGGIQGPPFSTNAQWSQYVLQYFSQNQYSAIPQRTDAIGKYLAGRAVDSQEEGWIQEAIAIGGKPPVAGSNGYPPSIRMSEPRHHGGKTYAHNPVAGLTARVDRDRGSQSQAEIRWHASPHAATYRVTVTSGKRTVSREDTSRTQHVLHGLARGREYEVRVLAQPARSSAREATHRFRA